MSSSIALEANDYSGRSGFSMLAWPIDINNAYPYMANYGSLFVTKRGNLWEIVGNSWILVGINGKLMGISGI